MISMNPLEFDHLLIHLFRKLAELQHTGLTRRRNFDVSFVWEDCDPLTRSFRSAGRRPRPTVQPEPTPLETN